MKNIFRCLLFCILAVPVVAQAVDGELGVSVFTTAEITGAVSWSPITYRIQYYYRGLLPGPNVILTDVGSPLVVFQSASVMPTRQNGDTLVWDLGTLDVAFNGEIEVNGRVNNGLTTGTKIENTALIYGQVIEEDSTNNVCTSVAEIESPFPDMVDLITGVLETPEGSPTSTAEEGMPVTLFVQYFNDSYYDASDVSIIDTLSPNLQFISADPLPISVSGQVVTWDVGDVPSLQLGQVKLLVRPVGSGEARIIAGVYSISGDRDSSNNVVDYTFDVVPVLEPLITSPAITPNENLDTLVTTGNPVFEGFARAGATVSLYEIDSAGCSDPLLQCNPVLLGQGLADATRRWKIIPVGITTPGAHHLCVQAEYQGSVSVPLNGFWVPFIVYIDPTLDSAGYDMSSYSITVGNHTYYPGGFGGNVGLLPDQAITIGLRVNVPPSIAADTAMWRYYPLYLTISRSGGVVEDTLYPSIEPVSLPRAAPRGGSGGDALHVVFDFHWHLPFLNNGDEDTIDPPPPPKPGCPGCTPIPRPRPRPIPIDPAGFVYDLDLARTEYKWPAVPPPGTLITTATVTAYERTGDSTFVRWPAEDWMQVNPQVTDASTEDSVKIEGYFSFLVPSGQYRISSQAPGYFDGSSGILTVINNPIYYNIGMRQVPKGSTGIRSDRLQSNQVRNYELFQNYPNPFNPSTTIRYELPKAIHVTLTIYDILGRKVATLVNGVEEPGYKSVHWDASEMASGVYFYRLQAGSYTETKKLLLLK